MKTDDFDYALPAELIAQSPPQQRGASRLLRIPDAGTAYQNLSFDQLGLCLQAGDLLVMNNTRVVPARVILHKPSGGRVEVMLERFTTDKKFLALAKSNKPLKAGQILQLDNRAVMAYLGRTNGFFEFELLNEQDISFFHTNGSTPLPPYINRQAKPSDAERYQTVVAKNDGAVAAPTAGLHFTPELFTDLKARGVQQAELTLHVGAGTFSPVKVDDVAKHTMHHERISVSSDLIEQIYETKARGGRVVAVGTTTVRALESAVQTGALQVFEGETNLFIFPGYKFKVVDAMVTNFHLPKSTLLMMISAFAGKQRVFDAYQYAIGQAYRFFSYGDAMFLTKSIDQHNAI